MRRHLFKSVLSPAPREPARAPKHTRAYIIIYSGVCLRASLGVRQSHSI